MQKFLFPSSSAPWNPGSKNERKKYRIFNNQVLNIWNFLMVVNCRFICTTCLYSKSLLLGQNWTNSPILSIDITVLTNPIKCLTCLCWISLRFLSFSSAARNCSSSSSCCCAAIAACSFSASSFCSRNASTSREENYLHWFSTSQVFMSVCQLIHFSEKLTSIFSNFDPLASGSLFFMFLVWNEIFSQLGFY